MDKKKLTDLEKAKELYLEFRLHEAYTLFRRYYDRLPFAPETEHAHYLSMFVRILYELGKGQELKFYAAALERQYNKTANPETGFQLAYVYCDPTNPRLKVAKEILEKIISGSLADEFRAKAKFCLAYCYDELSGDTASCRRIIDSINEPLEQNLNKLLQTWKAKILIDENNFKEAESLLNTLLVELTPQMDWYPFFLAKINLAKLFIKQDKFDGARSIIKETKEMTKGKPLKSLLHQIEYLEKILEEKNIMAPMGFSGEKGEQIVSYNGRSLPVDEDSLAGKLLLLLVKKRFLDKEMIVRGLYKRQYNGESDDKLIYYHIHTLRKKLQKVGAPIDTITNDGSGYRFVPEVQIL